MKIIILYIALGKYDIFWKDFYISAEKNLFPNSKKEYMVFTDASEIYSENSDNVKKIYQKNLGWPGNTLFRFRMFSSQIDAIKKYDYAIFFNANYIFKRRIDQNILPRDGLLVVQHPGYYNKDKSKLPYERGTDSLAGIPPAEGEVYVQGCLEGGTSESFIKMIDELADNIDFDYKKGVIAKWHDESHLNKYICSHKFKMLDPGYAYPEGWKIPYEIMMITRDKAKVCNYDKLRGINEPIMKKAKRIAKSTIKKIIRRN